MFGFVVAGIYAEIGSAAMVYMCGVFGCRGWLGDVFFQ